jgi:hypothetical protein
MTPEHILRGAVVQEGHSSHGVAGIARFMGVKNTPQVANVPQLF